MALTVSRDGGRTFSPPARVSEDGWSINACPDEGPAIAVDARGTAHIVWPTVMDGETPEGALFYASTRDGRRFTPRVRIPTLGSPKPANVQLAIDEAGRMVVAWDESVGGRHVAVLREIQVRPGGAPRFGEAVTIAPDGTAMYPVLATTGRGVVAVWSTGGAPSRVEARVLQLP
jgi:hypothetical protein